MNSVGKLSLLILRQLGDERFVIVVQAKAKERKLLPRCLEDVLIKYYNVLTKELFQKLLPKKEIDHKFKVALLKCNI
jgi:hypothetical protein